MDENIMDENCGSDNYGSDNYDTNNCDMNACTIEALLFAAGSSVAVEDIINVLQIDEEAFENTMDILMEKYASDSSGLLIRKIDDKYQMCSKPEYGKAISEYLALGQTQQLSQAAYEVLSIIAYGQPITRAKIEKIRGVNSDGVVSKLLERGLVEAKGKLDVPGRPSLFVTTEEFLRCFGYESIDDIPEMEFVTSQLRQMELDASPPQQTELDALQPQQPGLSIASPQQTEL